MDVKEAWASETDLGNRDPNELNTHLKVQVEEVLGEPDHTHSIDCLWRNSFKCFNLWKTLCYIILSTICGIPHAICWGCTFACVAFVHIWEVTPCIRCFDICMAVYRKCLIIFMSACVEPWCNACGAFFNVFRK